MNSRIISAVLWSSETFYFVSVKRKYFFSVWCVYINSWCYRITLCAACKWWAGLLFLFMGVISSLLDFFSEQRYRAKPLWWFTRLSLSLCVSSFSSVRFFTLVMISSPNTSFSITQSSFSSLRQHLTHTHTHTHTHTQSGFLAASRRVTKHHCSSLQETPSDTSLTTGDAHTHTHACAHTFSLATCLNRNWLE